MIQGRIVSFGVYYRACEKEPTLRLAPAGSPTGGMATAPFFKKQKKQGDIWPLLVMLL